MPQGKTTSDLPLKMRKDIEKDMTKTVNRFQVLSDKEDMETESSENENENDKNTTARRKTEKHTEDSGKLKILKPPPLVIHGEIKKHTDFLTRVKDVLKEKFYIKYNTNYTEVFTTSANDYKVLKELWIDNKIEFHTYTEKNNKKRAYVVRGLHAETDIIEISEDIKKQGFSAIKINLMKNTARPLYMATFSADIKLTELKQKIKFLCYTKISWENYINKNRLTQCHRCQEWGHATANCYAEPYCLKCAEKHLTKDCTKTKEIPAKCANCGGDHPANAMICPTYKKRVETLIHKTNVDNTKPKFNTKNYNLQDNKQFPNLKSRRENPWFQKAQNQSNTQPIINQNDDINTFEKTNTVNNYLNQNSTLIEIAKEISMINKICNINNMLSIIKELRCKLQNCESEIEKLQVFVSFAENLEKSKNE